MKTLALVLLLAVCTSASLVPSKVLAKLLPDITTNYIINGTDAKPHSAPYIISLSRQAGYIKHFCGGTLIAKQWILTAAHCLTTEATEMAAFGGLHKRLNYTAPHTQMRRVDFGMKHKSFTSGAGPYDIALLHVSEPFELNGYVQTAVLPTLEQIHEGEVVLYGWGQPKAYNLNGALILQTVTTQIVEWNKCKDTLSKSAPFVASNLCSDSLQRSISACTGDSGGPLVKEPQVVGNFSKTAPAEVIGIVSWGIVPCGSANLPSVYTRISAYLDWISNVQAAYYILH